MTIQNYLIIENNVVTNVVVWDGSNDWTPPEGSIQLVQNTTPAMVWVFNEDKTDYVLSEVMGAGTINDTWDGAVLTTGLPKPPAPTV
jgi:hypothetical protein